MTIFSAIVLGVVQGLSEFLPISSSGHLVLARHWMGLEPAEDVTFEVVVHLGTLLVVVLQFSRELRSVLRALPVLVQPRRWRERWDEPGFRYAVLVGLATLPLIPVGLFLKDEVEDLFSRPRLVAAMLLVTAGLLAIGSRHARPDRGSLPGPGQALATGLAQALAVIPGISRSGATISTALATGVGREQAGVLSFLMAIPAILGAAVLQARDLDPGHLDYPVLAAGFVAAAVSGYLALRVLLSLVRAGRLWIFTPYLVVVGTLALVL